jgi:hypothetical protein
MHLSGTTVEKRVKEAFKKRFGKKMIDYDSSEYEKNRLRYLRANGLLNYYK